MALLLDVNILVVEAVYRNDPEDFQVRFVIGTDRFSSQILL
jgi:hypothetical protein